MAITLDLQSEPDVAIGIASGPLSVAEAKQSAELMWQRVEGPTMRILWDLREATFKLDADEVRELAEYVKRRAPSVDLRTAFVVTKDLEFGLVRMFEAYREQDNAPTAAFRSRDAALDWLRGGG